MPKEHATIIASATNKCVLVVSRPPTACLPNMHSTTSWSPIFMVIKCISRHIGLQFNKSINTLKPYSKEMLLRPLQLDSMHKIHRWLLTYFRRVQRSRTAAVMTPLFPSRSSNTLRTEPRLPDAESAPPSASMLLHR